MGEDASTRSAAVTGSDAEQIQREIEATRQELGDTVEALAEKADVKSQAKRRIEETATAAAEKKDEVLGKARELSPDDAVAAASTAADRARANPVPVAAVLGFAGGFLIGRISRR
jgi:ElaB/YqjD/DUF883 family membrane-anchored ribosome-binding protein